MVGEPTNRLRGRIGVVADVLAGQELPREEATVEAGLGLGGGLRWRRAWVVGEGGCSLLATPSPAECAGMIRLGVDWFPLGRR
jgi:hypothetical protein